MRHLRSCWNSYAGVSKNVLLRPFFFNGISNNSVKMVLANNRDPSLESSGNRYKIKYHLRHCLIQPQSYTFIQKNCEPTLNYFEHTVLSGFVRLISCSKPILIFTHWLNKYVQERSFFFFSDCSDWNTEMISTKTNSIFSILRFHTE